MTTKSRNCIVLWQMNNDQWGWQVYVTDCDVPEHDDQQDFKTAEAACTNAVAWIKQNNCPFCKKPHDGGATCMGYYP